MRHDEKDLQVGTWRAVMAWVLSIVVGFVVASFIVVAAVFLPFVFTNI